MALHKEPNTNTQYLLNTLLKNVSRSFYLSMAILPAQLKLPISIAYLIARAADTIADTSIVPSAKRLNYLKLLQKRLDTNTPFSLNAILSELVPDNNNEQQLLRLLPDIFALFEKCADEDKHHIQHVVSTLISGMIYDLETFPDETSQQLQALSTDADLDRYTYLVAGCVGEFWTNVSLLHDSSTQHWNAQQQIERGIQLGKALQLTNILRDVPEDLRIGRCYLPASQLQRFGLKPEDLLKPENNTMVQPLLHYWLDISLKYYKAGADYAEALPRFAIRQRLAVYWPMLIGLTTLAKLANNPDWLSSDSKIKVTRRWVYKMICISIPAATSNRIMRWWLNRLHSRVYNQINNNSKLTNATH